MDKASVTRPSPPSIKAIVADEAFCKQVAALLLCEEQPVRDAFVGEPVEEVLEMVRWALSHEDDESFDTAEVLTAWAKKRGRGAWSGRRQRTASVRDDDAERLAVAVARMWVEQPQSLAQAIRALEIHRNGNGGA